MKFLTKTAFLGLISSQALFSMEQPTEMHHLLFNGERITASNVTQIGPQPSASLQQAVAAWAAKNSELLQQLASLPEDLSTRKEEVTRHNTLLEASGYINESGDPAAKRVGSNYIFKAKFDEQATTDHYVQIAGISNKLVNLWFANPETRALKYPTAATFTPENIAKLDTEQSTYQTISRRALSLVVLQALKETNAQRLNTNPVYLEHIPGRPYDANDNNWFAYQEEHKTNIKIHEHRELVGQIPNEAIEELYSVVKAVPLWDLARNIKAEQDEQGAVKELVLEDSEQPNNLHNIFDHFSKASFDNCVYEGLKGLAGHLVHDQEKITRLQNIIEKDEFMKTWSRTQDLKNTIADIIAKTKK